MTITPTIHLNGTSRSELLQQNLDAMDALRKAIEAVQNAAPNSRDYYVQSQSAFPQAQADHYRRLKALDQIKDEIEQIALAISKNY